MSQPKLDIQLQDKWERIVFHTIDSMIPSDLMLNELIHSPMQNLSWVLNIFREYQPPEVEKIQSVIDKGILDTKDPRFDELINPSEWDKKLEAIASLRQYESPSRSPDSESLSILQLFSNNFVDLIGKELLKHTPLDDIEMKFCFKYGIDWNIIRYHRAVLDYCFQILPHPMNYVKNTDKDSALSIFQSEQIKHWQKTGGTLRHPDPCLAEYEERKEEAERRIAILFSDYRYSRWQLSDFTHLFVAEHPEIHQERIELNYSTVTSNRSYRRSKKPNEKDLMLCRCEFCYRFRTIELSRGTTTPAWHCHRTKCEKQYTYWKNKLNEKDINLETLY
jgi:hypothetical protein